jgi:hypothetical protein
MNGSVSTPNSATMNGTLCAAARQLRGNPTGKPHSLRKIAAHLAERGYVTPSGRPY